MRNLSRKCMSESVGPNSRGRPLVRWRDRVKEYMCESLRGVLPEEEGWIKQGWSVWIGRGGDFSAVAIPLGDVPGGSGRQRYR